MRVAGIIPARMGSFRFPGKPLALLLGRPMIEHVYHRTALCAALDAVYIATCDTEIADAVAGFGGKAIMTANTHERASDRVAEAAERIDADVIVMVQGDEPMIIPEMIDAAIEPFRNDQTVQCVNLTKRIETVEEFENPNTIKVVIAGNGDALCFSREPIPTSGLAGFENIHPFKQVCIIPFRSTALARFAALSPTPGEIAESVDMMRYLEHGIPVRMVETTHDSHAVDTTEDLARVEAMMRDDPLVQSYWKKLIS